MIIDCFRVRVGRWLVLREHRQYRVTANRRRWGPTKIRTFGSAMGPIHDSKGHGVAAPTGFENGKSHFDGL
jgi:hypothetical protein